MEQVVQTGLVALSAESFGNHADEPVLLLAGTSCSMDWWPARLCEALAERGLFVIRFDQRDTGRSTFDPPGEPSYSLPDLAADARGVLDHFGIRSAHWVGFSQGGWVAQLAAIATPDRVRSLTLMSTRATGHGPADSDLPEVTSRLLDVWEEGSGEPDWEQSAEVVQYLVDGEESIAGDEFDAAHAQSISERCVQRALQVRSAVTNHPIADQGPRWRERLRDVTAPCLILHGTADPLFPFGNAEALAREIPGARLEPLVGVGHELPPRVWVRACDLISEHVQAVSAE